MNLMDPQNIPPQPPLTEPVVPQPHKSFSLPLIIGGLLLILFIGVGTSYLGKRQTTPPTPIFSPTAIPTIQDETANWGTYSSSKYSFSIKYPPDWKYLEVPNSTYQTVYNAVWFAPSSSSWPRPQTGQQPPLMLILTQKDPSTNFKPEFYTDFKSEIYQIGTISGQKFSGINKEGLNYETVIIAKIGNYYINISTNNNKGEFNSTDNQILSTFKFLNKNQTTDTSNWKIYQSTIGISFFKPNNADVIEPKLTANLDIEFKDNKRENQEIVDGWIIDITFSPNQTTLTSPKNRAEDLKSFDDKDGCSTTPITIILIDGKTTYNYFVTKCFHFSSSRYIVKSDTTYYEINASYVGNIEKYKEITSKIISSITFTPTNIIPK